MSRDESAFLLVYECSHCGMAGCECPDTSETGTMDKNTKRAIDRMRETVDKLRDSHADMGVLDALDGIEDAIESFEDALARGGE